VLPSFTVPLNHDGWSWTAIGHGCRCLFDQLASLDHPVSVSELACHPALSNDRKTIRRQLRKLEAFGLASRLSSGKWVVLADHLDNALEAAAELTERNGERLSERLRQQHEKERIAYAKATDPVERKRKEADQLRRVCQRRKARRRDDRQRPRVRQRHPLHDPAELRQRREDRSLVRRQIHHPRVIRSGRAAKPQYVLAPPPIDFTGVP
jgi:superfamily II DNA helicase RecQ